MSALWASLVLSLVSTEHCVPRTVYRVSVPCTQHSVLRTGYAVSALVFSAAPSCFASPSQVGHKVQIAWNLKTGDRFFVEEVTSVRQTVNVGADEARRQLEQTKILRYTVVATNRESLMLEKKIERVKIALAAGGEWPADAKVLAALEGAVFQLVVNKMGTVEKLDGYEQLVKRIVREDADTARLFRVAVTEDSLKTPAEGLFQLVPERDVTEGDRWHRTSKVSLGPLGTMSSKDTYILLGEDEKEKDLLKIGVTSQRAYVLPGKTSASPINVTQGLVRSDKAEGTLWFHAKRGRLVRAEAHHVLKGHLTLSTASGPVEMELIHHQATKIRVLEKNPLENKN